MNLISEDEHYRLGRHLLFLPIDVSRLVSREEAVGASLRTFCRGRRNLDSNQGVSIAIHASRADNYIPSK